MTKSFNAFCAFVFILFVLGPLPVRAAETLLIGVPISFTGEHAINGKHAKKGYDIARKLINEKGGVKVDGKTYRLKFKYYNDESNPNLSAKFAKRLIKKDKVRFLLGPYSTSTTATVAEVAEKYRVPLVQANGASLSLFDKGYKYMVGVLTAADSYMSGAVELAARSTEKNGGKASSIKVAIAVENDPFSRDLRQGVLNEAKKHGMSVIIDETLPRDYSDMTFILNKVKSMKPDILVISGHEGGAKLAAKQIYEQKVDVPMVAMTHCEGADIHGKFGLRVDNFICATQWSSDMSYTGKWFGGANQYRRRFEADYGFSPPYQSAESSAAVLVLASALERANTLDREKVMAALKSTNLETFFGRIKFDHTGKNIAKPMILRQLKSGRYLVVAPAQFANHEVVYPQPEWAKR